MVSKNKFIEDIIVNNTHIATIVKPSYATDGLSFITNDKKFIQVGIWKYRKGTRLDTHFHNQFSRSALKTNESVYVVQGTIKCNLYYENGEFISSHILKDGEMIIQFNGAHEYIIQKDSIVIENKNGPYFGPELDRTRI